MCLLCSYRCVLNGKVVPFTHSILKRIYTPDPRVLRIICSENEPSFEDFVRQVSEPPKAPQAESRAQEQVVCEASVQKKALDGMVGAGHDEDFDLASFPDNGRLFLARRSNSLQPHSPSIENTATEGAANLQDTVNSSAALCAYHQRYIPQILTHDSAETECHHDTTDLRPVPASSDVLSQSDYVPAVLQFGASAGCKTAPQSRASPSSRASTSNEYQPPERYSPVSSKYIPAAALYVPAIVSTSTSACAGVGCSSSSVDEQKYVPVCHRQNGAVEVCDEYLPKVLQ